MAITVTLALTRRPRASARFTLARPLRVSFRSVACACCAPIARERPLQARALRCPAECEAAAAGRRAGAGCSARTGRSIPCVAARWRPTPLSFSFGSSRRACFSEPSAFSRPPLATLPDRPVRRSTPLVERARERSHAELLVAREHESRRAGDVRRGHRRAVVVDELRAGVRAAEAAHRDVVELRAVRRDRTRSSRGGSAATGRPRRRSARCRAGCRRMRPARSRTSGGSMSLVHDAPSVETSGDR